MGQESDTDGNLCKQPMANMEGFVKLVGKEFVVFAYLLVVIK